VNFEGGNYTRPFLSPPRGRIVNKHRTSARSAG